MNGFEIESLKDSKYPKKGFRISRVLHAITLDPKSQWSWVLSAISGPTCSFHRRFIPGTPCTTKALGVWAPTSQALRVQGPT